VDKVEIVFEKESAIFHDGDHITGMVLIKSNDDIAYKCKYSVNLYTYMQGCGVLVFFVGHCIWRIKYYHYYSDSDSNSRNYYVTWLYT